MKPWPRGVMSSTPETGSPLSGSAPRRRTTRPRRRIVATGVAVASAARTAAVTGSGGVAATLGLDGPATAERRRSPPRRRHRLVRRPRACARGSPRRAPRAAASGSARCPARRRARAGRPGVGSRGAVDIRRGGIGGGRLASIAAAFAGSCRSAGRRRRVRARGRQLGRPSFRVSLICAASQPSSPPSASATGRTESASRSCGAATQRQAGAAQQDVGDDRACSSRAAITTSASRSGRPGDDRRGQLGSLGGERAARCARRGRSGRRVARRSPRAAVASATLGRLEVLVLGRHPERDLGGAARRLAAVALDHPVDDLLGHPPPGRQLAAGDRQHPRRGLVELRLARDVDRLLGSPVEISGRTPA